MSSCFNEITSHIVSYNNQTCNQSIFLHKLLQSLIWYVLTGEYQINDRVIIPENPDSQDIISDLTDIVESDKHSIKKMMEMMSLCVEIGEENQEYITILNAINTSLEHLYDNVFKENDENNENNNPLSLQKRKKQFSEEQLSKDLNLLNKVVLLATIDHCLIETSDYTIKLIELSQGVVDEPFGDAYRYKLSYLFWKITKVYKEDLSKLRYSYHSTFHKILKDIKGYNFEEVTVFKNGNHVAIEVIHSWTRDERTIDDFYHATKHYKCDHESELLLKKLLKKFKKIYYKKLSKDSDIKSEELSRWHLAYNYILNNLLSLKLKSAGEDDIKECQKLLKEIETIQEETEIFNYYPHQRYLEFISRIAKDELCKKKVNNDKIEKYQKEIRSTLNKFQFCYEYSILNHLQVFKKSAEFCYTKKTFHDKCIYIASSDLVPISFHKINESLMTGKNMLKYIQENVYLHLSISDQIKNIETIKRNYENSEKNQVQILGIFSALVFVAAGGISIFKEIKHIYKAAIYTCFFMYAIALMVLLIWFTNRHSDEKKGCKYWFAIVFFISAVIFEMYILFLLRGYDLYDSISNFVG